MATEMEEVLVSVWRQALVDGRKAVTLGEQSFPVRETPKSKLKQVDFQFLDRELRGLEQNPHTKSRWAALARKGQRVMQFLEGGRYVAVVVDGQAKRYGR